MFVASFFDSIFGDDIESIGDRSIDETLSSNKLLHDLVTWRWARDETEVLGPDWLLIKRAVLQHSSFRVGVGPGRRMRSIHASHVQIPTLTFNKQYFFRLLKF